MRGGWTEEGEGEGDGPVCLALIRASRAARTATTITLCSVRVIPPSFRRGRVGVVVSHGYSKFLPSPPEGEGETKGLLARLFIRPPPPLLPRVPRHAHSHFNRGKYILLSPVRPPVSPRVPSPPPPGGGGRGSAVCRCQHRYCSRDLREKHTHIHAHTHRATLSYLFSLDNAQALAPARRGEGNMIFSI